MTSLSSKKLLTACAAGALLAAGSVQAQDATWTNTDPGDNLWSTADNWDTSAVPGSGDQAEINLSGADRAIVDTGDPNLPAAFGRLRIGQGSGTNGELEVISGTLNADDTTQDRIGVGGGTGVVNQSGGTVRLGGGQVQLGRPPARTTLPAVPSSVRGNRGARRCLSDNPAGTALLTSRAERF